LEDSSLDKQIILKQIFKNWNGGMDWIDLARNRERRRAVVNAVINLQVP
jgi:Mor family transcriptional regulator